MENHLPGKQEIRNRIERLQHAMSEKGMDGALLVQKVDLYYFSGTDQDAHLWVPASGDAVLLVRKSLERARADAMLEPVLPLRSLSELPDRIRDLSGSLPKRLGLEMDVIPAGLYLHYRRILGDTELLDVSPLVRNVRMIKSAFELSRIHAAAGIADELYRRVPDYIRISGTETDLAIRAEGFYRSQGHSGLSRTRAFNMESIYGHIMAGPGGAAPSGTVGPTGGVGLGPWFSQGAGWAPILPGQPIMVDYTACRDGYLSDQARIFSLGPLPEKMQRAYAAMVEVQDALASAGRPGTEVRSLYTLALDMADRAGLSDGFMGWPHPVPFVGHGVGLELDEWPVVTDRGAGFVLEEGMVLALEPKVVFPDEGVVGIENTFVVGPGGMEKLNGYSDELIVL